MLEFSLSVGMRGLSRMQWSAAGIAKARPRSSEFRASWAARRLWRWGIGHSSAPLAGLFGVRLICKQCWISSRAGILASGDRCLRFSDRVRDDFLKGHDRNEFDALNSRLRRQRYPEGLRRVPVLESENGEEIVAPKYSKLFQYDVLQILVAIGRPFIKMKRSERPAERGHEIADWP